MSDSDELTMPIIGLIVNALLLPGLGTILGGRVRDGIIQAALIILLPAIVFIAVASVTTGQGPDASQALFPLAIGALIVGLGVWVWAILSMVLEISERSKRRSGPTP